MWRSLYRWVLRRPLTTGPGDQVFSYSRVVTPIFGVFIGLSAIEIPILHLVLPWETVRLIVDLAGVYGLFWMIGFLACLRVHPHVIGAAGLRIRHSLSVDVTVPWGAVAAVRARYRSLPGRTVQVEATDSGDVLHIGMLKQTSVDVILRGPTTLALSKDRSETVTELRFHADDPEDFVARAREHLKVDAPSSER